MTQNPFGPIHSQANPRNRSRRGREGSVPWIVGLVAGGMILLAQVLLQVLTFDSYARVPTNGGIYVTILKAFTYPIAGYIVASQVYMIQRANLKPARGIIGRAAQAGYIIAISSWVSAVAVAFVEDLLRITIYVEPIGLFIAILFDVVAAGLLTAAGAKFYLGPKQKSGGGGKSRGGF